MHIIGCDFSSSPSKRKAIVVAVSKPLKSDFLGEKGQLYPYSLALSLQKTERFVSLADFATWLKTSTDWVGGFDLPFGLPRELVLSLGWPTQWHTCMQHYQGLSREQIRLAFKGFCDARAVGSKFAHRATDGPAGSSPSMKWVNPPVAYMLHAGVPLLLAAGCHFPGLHPGNPAKVALEAYPGLLARRILGTQSYKSDDPAKQTPERLIARKTLLQALELGSSNLPRLRLTDAQRDAAVADASGDTLDALLCMLQAAWAQTQHANGHACYGLPPFDPLEGWIVGA
jgi:hypothetical protein